MRYPIVFIQQNNTDYLFYALLQAREANPDAEIYLIGDQKNNLYNFIKHINITDFSAKAEEFKKYYKHLSPNNYDFELICFQRWFILKEFMQKYGYTKALHLDTDVMLYSKVSEESKFNDYDWALSGDDYDNGYFACGHVCFINNLEVLSGFCDFMLDYYKNPEKLTEIVQLNELLKEKQISSAISDMIFLKKFIITKKYKTAQVSRIIDGTLYDNNFNFAGDFKPNGNTKHIEFHDKKPFGYCLSSNEDVQFHALHFQGATKCLMRKYHTVNRLKLNYYRLISNIKSIMVNI